MKKTEPAKPTFNQILGELGEQIACDYLLKKGYKLLSANYSPKGCNAEIDMIVEHVDLPNTIVIVEVKTRTKSDFGWPELQVGNGKQRNMAETAGIWMEKHNRHSDECRFDIIAIEINKDNTKNPEIRHIADAFFPGLF